MQQNSEKTTIQPTSNPTPAAPRVELVIGNHCPHCHSLLEAASALVREGLIGQLDIYNAGQNPQLVEQRSIRSLPWTRVGDFVFLEAMSRSELEQWCRHAASQGGRSDYFLYLLEHRRLDELMELLLESPHWIHDLAAPLALEQTPITTQIAIGAAIEDMAERDPGLLAELVPDLLSLLDSERPQVRADAAHYLALAQATEAIPRIEMLLEDPDPQVQEITRDSLAVLQGLTQS